MMSESLCDSVDINLDENTSVYSICLSVVLVGFGLVETSRMGTLLGKNK